MSRVQTADLEKLLGNPYDPDNPCGHDAVLAADERRELPGAAVRALDNWCFNAELVPAALGGRLKGTDQLVRALRPVFRRDGALGLGYGITNFIAAINVWMSGNDEQRRHVATTLLDGGKIAAAYHELGHGNDLLHNELRADQTGDNFAITGRKEVINNAAYAGQAVVFARTDPKPGPRSHSLLLVDTAADAPSLTRVPRFRTVGMRGCHLSGFDFDQHRVPVDSMIGAPGTAVEIPRRAYPRHPVRHRRTRCRRGRRCTRRGARKFAQQRRLYGGTVAQIPHARTVMVDAFADLLVADAFATTAARLLHTAPQHGSRYAASVKYVVPIMLEDAARSLAVVLGARSFLRTGEYAIVGKHLRHLPVLAIGHAGGTACLLTVLPQLISLGRLGEGADAVPASTFDTTALPELTSALCRGRGHDPLIGTLAAQLADLSHAVDPPGGLWSSNCAATCARCSTMRDRCPRTAAVSTPLPPRSDSLSVTPCSVLPPAASACGRPGGYPRPCPTPSGCGRCWAGRSQARTPHPCRPRP